MDLDPATQPTPEQEKSKEPDNARKFTTGPLSAEFLEEHGAIPFLLITDWTDWTETETGEDDETKVVYKKFLDDDVVEIFYISKTTDKDGNRDKQKEEITADNEKYEKLKDSSKRHVEKVRHEFTFTQNGILFVMNYDEFAGGTLFMLDVDAKSKDKEERDSFNPKEFPSKDFTVELVEVSDDPQYSGHRLAEIL